MWLHNSVVVWSTDATQTGEGGRKGKHTRCLLPYLCSPDGLFSTLTERLQTKGLNHTMLALDSVNQYLRFLPTSLEDLF